MTRRVVITGMGTVNPLGLTVEEYWRRLAHGESGIGIVNRFDNSTMATRIGGLVRDFDHMTWFKDQKMARRLDRAIIYAHVAACQAMADSGIEGKYDPERAGAIIATGMGGVSTFESDTRVMIERGHKRVSPFFVPMILPNTVSAYFAIENNLQGPNYTILSACASANHSMGEAYEIIKRGTADVMFTGGAESAMCEVIYAGFGNMKALSTRNDDPAGASRPFDKGRDGFVMGEGGAVMVLEELEHAKARGARIYAEFAGYGMSCDAHHITAPCSDGAGGYRAMRNALQSAQMNPDAIDLVNAHGTSTPLGDAGETMAIKRCFGDHAKSKLLVHSTKSMIGHALGAAGAVEAVALMMALVRGVVHPTINQQEPDPECDLNYVPNEAVEKRVNAALSNSFGFGGHNATLIFKRFG
ncbi:MAG: beta-ketoacyl-[acyl-carrier-protein] synthase [Fibrobacteres bacterium]|nr:beta-ketoacyl-[acyl-carrier-protein] synthase [Fibrobacterota bacterium]